MQKEGTETKEKLGSVDLTKLTEETWSAYLWAFLIGKNKTKLF